MYITYEDLVARYSILRTWGRSPTEVNSDLIFYAESELNGLLAPAFTVPFDAAHPTIKDLTIDLAYVKAMFTKDPKVALQYRKELYLRIEEIKAGKEILYTGSGTTILPNVPANEPWSSSENYLPTHTMLGSEDDGVDPDLLKDLSSGVL
jgi:hypothetical protein